MKCCHESAVLLCPHPCRACRKDEAEKLVAKIITFARECDDAEHMDTGRAGELLNDSAKLFKKIVKEGS